MQFEASTGGHPSSFFSFPPVPTTSTGRPPLIAIVLDVFSRKNLRSPTGYCHRVSSSHPPIPWDMGQTGLMQAYSIIKMPFMEVFKLKSFDDLVVYTCIRPFGRFYGWLEFHTVGFFLEHLSHHSVRCTDEKKERNPRLGPQKKNLLQ